MESETRFTEFEHRKGNSSAVEMSKELTDVLFQHFNRTCSVRELVQLQSVSKTWKTLVFDNLALATEARLKDKIKDWYFPVCFEKKFCKEETCTRRQCKSLINGYIWIWFGIHHSSRVLELHPLPPLPLSLHGTTIEGVVASYGGLLLVSNTTTLQDWIPLVVWNPLTKQCKELPTVNKVRKWNYNDVHYQMMVDEQANSYKVFLVFRAWLCVYSSASNSWDCRAFPEIAPWGKCHLFGKRYQFMVSPSAIIGEKLFYADLDVGGNVVQTLRVHPRVSDLDVRTQGVVRVFEIDEEACTWKPPIRYALRNHFPQSPDDNYGFDNNSYGFKLVECMGGLYAIIPASYHGLLTSENGVIIHNNYLPLQFYIVELKGGVGLKGVGQLLIENPCNPNMSAEQVAFRHSKSLECLNRVFSFRYLDKPFPDLGEWFRCTARRTVIWLSLWDYLLQYDVVSGQSKTEIVGDISFGVEPNFSYKPSFHMKP